MQENLNHGQELWKHAYNKCVNPWNYVFDNKVWLNIQYIKTKPKPKLKTKFFQLFQILYPVKKQTYKLKFPKNLKIHDVIYVSLQKQNSTKKVLINKKNMTKLGVSNDENRKYEIEVIWDSAVYIKESKDDFLELYYLIS